MKRFDLSPFKSMSIYAISIFLMKGVSLVMLPIMANYFSPSQLGELELIATTTVFLSLLVGLSMHENLYRFVGSLRGKIQRKNKTATIYYSCLITSAVFCLAFILLLQQLKQHLSMFTEYQLILIVVVLLFESGLAISTAWLRMQDKAMTFFKVSITCTFLQVSLILGVLLTTPDVTLVFAAGVFSTFVQFLILHTINQFQFTLPDLATLKQYFNYSLPLMLSAMVAFGLNGAERWFIAYSSSLETLGLYAIAAKFALAMCILVQPFGMWWMPKRFETLDQGGRSKASLITELGVFYICALAVIVGIGAQVAIKVTLPDAYLGACALVVGAIIMAMLKEISDLINIGLLYRKKTHWLLAINSLSTTVGLLLCWFTLSFGVWGVITSIIIAQATRLILIGYFSHSVYSMPYQYIRLVMTLSLTISLLGVTQLISSISGLLLLSLSILAVACTIFWFMKANFSYSLINSQPTR